MTRGSVTIRVDFKSQALIQRCATVLAAAGLEDIIDHMAEAGMFREAATERKGFRDIVIVGLGPMTELLLVEFCDVAQRPWSESAKRHYMQMIAEMAGFA